jgi:hypothetical protein
LITIVETGERKTAADRLALRPIINREAFLREEYAHNLTMFVRDQDAYRAARATALKNITGNALGRDAARQAIDALGPEPRAPLNPICLAPTQPTRVSSKLFRMASRQWGCSLMRVDSLSAEMG